MVAALDDNAWLVRIQAANALGLIGTSAVIPKLEKLLSDNNPKVSAEAQRIIEKLKSKV